MSKSIIFSEGLVEEMGKILSSQVTLEKFFAWLCLCFFMCEMGTKIVSTLPGDYEYWELIFIKHLEQCRTHGKPWNA